MNFSLKCIFLTLTLVTGVGHKYDIVGGNHDLEGIDEFATVGCCHLKPALKAPDSSA